MAVDCLFLIIVCMCVSVNPLCLWSVHRILFLWLKNACLLAALLIRLGVSIETFCIVSNFTVMHLKI